MVYYLCGAYPVSQRRACRTVLVSRSTVRYQGRCEPRTALRQRIREIAQARVRYGYRKIRVLLKREGWNVGKKLVYRLYREEGLTLRYKRRRKRGAAMNRRERLKPAASNEVWSLDFVADQLADGRRFRALTIVDVFTRESLAIEVGQSLKGQDVVRVLSRIALQRALPKTLFCDNGSEFTSQAMDLWAYHAGVRIDFSRPGKPDRQCLRGIVQRHTAVGMSGCALVRIIGGGQTDYRDVAKGIQRESSSQGPWGTDAIRNRL
jgi:putative transposase